MATSVSVIPPSHFALAYVDELLLCFTTHPQKSIQHVFQRLLVVAGREVAGVSEHIAATLIASIGFGERVPGILQENHANTLIKLIIRYAIEEVEGRNELEMKGATQLLYSLAETMSEHLSHPHSYVGTNRNQRKGHAAPPPSPEGESICPNECFQHLSMDKPHLQAAFASILTVTNDFEPLVDQLIEDGLNAMVDEFQSRGTRFPLRVEFFQTIVQSYLNSNMPSVCPLGVCKIINSVVHDSTRNIAKAKRPLQPLLFNLLAKRRHVMANLSLDKLFFQAADVVRKGCANLNELTVLAYECRSMKLANALLADGGRETYWKEGAVDFFRKEVNIYFMGPDCIANAIIALVNSELRIGAPSGCETEGRLPWNPTALARAIDEYAMMRLLTWELVFHQLDQPTFRFPSVAGIIFFVNFFESLECKFPMHIMYKRWAFVDGQLDFFERTLKMPEGGVMDRFKFTAADVTCLEHQPDPTDCLFINMRSLELYQLLLTIQYTHVAWVGRVNNILEYCIARYPDVLAVALMQMKVFFSEFGITVILMALEEMLKGHKNLKSVLIYAAAESENPWLSNDITFHALGSLLIKMNQCQQMGSAPDKMEFTEKIIRLFHEVNPNILYYLVMHFEIESAFEYALICHNLGLYQFEDYLTYRIAIEEERVPFLKMLSKDVKIKKLHAYNSKFAEMIHAFLLKNLDSFKKYGVDVPSSLKPVHKPLPVAAVVPPKETKLAKKETAKETKKEKKKKAKQQSQAPQEVVQPAVVETAPEPAVPATLTSPAPKRKELPKVEVKLDTDIFEENVIALDVSDLPPEVIEFVKTEAEVEESHEPVPAEPEPPVEAPKTPSPVPPEPIPPLQAQLAPPDTILSNNLVSPAPKPLVPPVPTVTNLPSPIKPPQKIEPVMVFEQQQPKHPTAVPEHRVPPIERPLVTSNRPVGPPPGFQNVSMVMRESGRSSSVLSNSRAPPSLLPQTPIQDPRMQRNSYNSQTPFNPFNNYMQQAPAPNAANIGLGTIGNSTNFGGSQELIRPPGSQAFGSNSPTNQTRPGMPPAPIRQNSSSSWNIPGSAPRSTGPPTPLQFEFRGQGPPTQQDFQPRANPQPQIFDLDLSQMQFADDVQEEANGYFEAIYTHRAHVLTVTALLDRLKGFKNSIETREHKLLACVVKNLFEEYKFFNDYPERELRITAELYGGIIREGIINEQANLHFATAVRKVIESLSQLPSSNLFNFGVVALENCRTKLCTYPKVCSMIASLENFTKFPKNIQEYVVVGMNGDLSRLSQVAAPADPPGRSTPPVWAQARSSTDNRSAAGNITVPNNRTGNNVLSYTNVDTLVKATESEGAEVAQPAEVIVDKMSFLFNNLSQTNMGAKKEEVLGIIADHGEPFIKWLAQYIVMKRVSIEQNFQPLYNTFVQVLDHPLLDLHIKKETFRNIRILLRSDKRQAASNYSDRQLLKNLGMWLGAITIARSKPVLLDELDLKSLLLEAYYKGQQELLFVVPFIAKILLSCSKTPIFSPSCAWIKSILKVLAELHNEPDLKINLKFEIEVLCKELSVDLQSLPIEGILKDTDRLIRVNQQLSAIPLLSPPNSNQLAGSSPVPQQGGQAIPTPGGTDTKPSTPLPDGDNGGVVEPVQSHFAYQDINVISYEGLAPHLQIKSNLPLFQLHPHLKQVVRPSLTLAIKELIGPVSERAQKIAMTVTENLIRKDFALDPNEKNLKTASFHMMRAMTAGMAMITCRDPLAVTMANSLTNAFSNALRNSVNSPETVKMIEEATSVITQENVELSTNFIVKTACEKAASEMEKRLEPEFQKRINARQAGKQYCDEAALSIQNMLPEQLSFQPGETPKELLDIYMQFSTRICGFKPSASEELSPDAARPLILTEERASDHLSGQLAMIIKEVDNTMTAQPNVGNKAFTAVGIIRDLLQQLALNPRDGAALGNVIGKSVEHFLHAFHVDPNTKNPLDVEWPRRLRDLFIGVTRLCLNLTALTEIARKITSTIVALNVDYKWNVEGIEVLYKHSLIQTSPFDQHIAAKMCSGPSVDQATFFAQRLFRALSGDNRAQFQSLFPLTYEQLLKISQMMPGRIPAPGETGGLNSPLLDGESNGDHELSTKVVESVLREWIAMCYSPAAQRNPQDALSSMIHVMHDHGCLSTDEKVSAFFKTCTEMCVEVANKMLRSDNGQSAHQSSIIRQRCYYTLDAYVKLIALMIKYSDGNQTQTKITLLKKILSLITNVLTLDHEMRGKEFNALPYHRILITLFNELTTPDGTALDQLQWNVLESFGQALFMLQPRRVPGFAYAWLDIVGHRNVIGKLLGGAPENPDTIKMAAMYTQLIICHLKFLAPFLRNIQMPKPISVLYRGTLRVLLVILHDFPELLCEFHYVICDTIPANCVQLRNLVLSAYPRNMRLPDPFASNFKQVDTIPEMAQEPKSNLNMSTIIPDPIRVQLDDYLTNRTNVDFLTTLPTLLQQTQTPGQKYNTTVLNAVVLYVGIKAIESLHQKRMTINIHTIAHTSYMDVFQNLAVQLCTEGRYLLFNAIANQLRYPNAHTHYFSCVFLFLFLNSDYDAIQEQITRILFERLVALRPHPWGLLITFIELIKNPVYNFWKFEFTRCAPEIERLFQNVANTCVSANRAPAAEQVPRT